MRRRHGWAPVTASTTRRPDPTPEGFGGVVYVLTGPGHATGVPDGSDRPDGEWTLTALAAGRTTWVVRLAAHGAATMASPRVARSVALRVLQGRGVAVVTWRSGGSDDRPVFHAVPPSTTTRAVHDAHRRDRR